MDRNYSNIIESFRGIACIMSLRKSEDGSGEVYTIAAANRAYFESVNKADEEFVPHRPYTYYVPGDPNFEYLVKSCIIDGKISHQYIKAGQYNAGLDVYMIPLESSGLHSKGYTQSM